MIFLLSLCLALAFAWFGAKWIKGHAAVIYLLASGVSIAVIGVTHSGLTSRLPEWIRNWIWPMLSNCALATALFAVVMFMAVLPRGGKAVKTLLPIRAELSILACILTLGHNIAYGKTYFIMLLTRPERLEGHLLWAAVCSVMLILIMLPLMVTSFPKVRKKMKARAWKKLQRLAYLFYGLVYIHVMLLAMVFLDDGKGEYLWNVLAYSGVFLSYGILRIRRAMIRKYPDMTRKMTAVLTIVAVTIVSMLCVSKMIPRQQDLSSEITPVPEADPVVYMDGVYFGTGEGYVGTTQVAVTVTDGRISSVIVVSSEDDTSYVEDAKALIPDVIASQRTSLDAVSGATYTSDAILSAIEDALSAAIA